MKKFIHHPFITILFIFFFSTMAAQTAPQVNELRKKDSMNFDSRLIKLENSYIDFNEGFVVSGSKVNNILTPALLDSIKKGKFVSPVTSPVTTGLIDSIRKSMLAQVELTNIIARLQKDIDTLKTANKLLTGQVSTLIANDQTFNDRFRDSTSSLRSGVNQLNTRYNQLNTTVYLNNTNQQKTNDSLRNNISTLVQKNKDFTTELQTMDGKIGLLKIDVDACKAYDALLEKTPIILPKRP